MQLTEMPMQVQLYNMRTQQQHKPTILIAGGGSGGHVAPAIAAAEALTEQGASVLLAHSTRKVDFDMMCESPFENLSIPASPLSTKPIGFLRFCMHFFSASKKVRSLIKQRNISCVLATGGFVSAPALHAARKLGCKTVLLNLDNPPGKANKLAVRWADSILSTVACNLNKATLINPPLRQSVISSRSAQTCKTRLGLDLKRKTLLVTGASQGATTINQLIPELAKNNPASFHGWEILHIAGEANIEAVKKLWADSNVPSTVLGFTHSMADAWGAADLAVTRGGANTIAEIAINCVPSMVLPYPYHKDDHQRTNAEPLEKSGAVIIAKDHKQLELNLHNAGAQLITLLSNHQMRFSMREKMLHAPMKNGANSIANACLR
jgi:UDP-N-acetylglucosamine--N-acetylmuramyl-(pentapeptide) pyrophosphoryl-undecaprenol N-acetylglucosamine transferase